VLSRRKFLAWMGVGAAAGAVPIGALAETGSTPVGPLYKTPADNPNGAYEAVRVPSVILYDADGIYVSSDNGTNWRKVQPPPLYI
jgi:hypothetical protein